MISSIAVQVLPMTANENDVIKIVDHVIAYIDASGVNYQVGAFESTLEGDYDQLMSLLAQLPKVAAAEAKKKKDEEEVLFKKEEKSTTKTVEKKEEKPVEKK